MSKSIVTKSETSKTDLLLRPDHYFVYYNTGVTKAERARYGSRGHGQENENKATRIFLPIKNNPRNLIHERQFSAMPLSVSLCVCPCVRVCLCLYV